MVVAHGTTYDAVTVAQVSNITCVVPPHAEQTQIANFLDRKTEQIDELIRIKARRVELLQEQRIALIHETVTKGLDPNAEMKPSGVEYIGEIPKDWEVKRIKQIALFIGGYSDFGHELYTDSGIPIFRIGDITQFIKMEKVKRVPAQQVKKLQQNQGDFIVNKLLAWMGAIGLSNYEGVTSPAYDILRKIRPLNERFYEYLFRCGLYYTEFKKRSKGIMDVRLRLYFNQFGQIPLVFPPVDEQDKIANFLDHKTAKIDELRSNEQRSVELLKEYRQTLISEVVTGKIDVRNEV